MLKLLTCNAGLLRITPANIVSLNWLKRRLAATGHLPNVSNVKNQLSLGSKLKSRLAGLLDVSIWAQTAAIDQRLEALPRAIQAQDIDIVCLQEVFETYHRDYLRDSLKAVYPYAALNPSRICLGVNDGLMIFSRFPIIEGGFERFKNGPWEERHLMARGTQWVHVDVPWGDPVVIVNSHLTAAVTFRNQYSPDAAKLRRAQIIELLDLINRVADPRRVILVGDMNCGQTHSAEEYQMILDAGYVDGFMAAPGHPTGETAVTFDSIHNPLNEKFKPTIDPPERLDHFFVKINSDLVATHADIVLRDACVLSAAGGGALVPISDHYAVKLHFEDIQVDSSQ